MFYAVDRTPLCLRAEDADLSKAPAGVVGRISLHCISGLAPAAASGLSKMLRSGGNFSRLSVREA